MLFVITNRNSKGGSFGGKPRPNHQLVYLSGEDLECRSGATFQKRLLGELEKQRLVGINNPSILCFLHGYNVSYEESLDWFRHLEEVLARKMAGPAVMLGFSWPSDGSLAGYFGDSQAARDSAPAMAKAMIDGFKLIHQDCNAELKMICHSRGNFVLANATNLAAELLGFPSRYPVFSEILLVAADLDNNSMEVGRIAANIAVFGRRVTIYRSRHDGALGASQVKRIGVTGPRIGRQGPAKPELLPDHVVVIDSSSFTLGVVDEDNKNIRPHSAHFWSEKILDDMLSVLNGKDRLEIMGRSVIGRNQFELVGKK